MMHRACAFLLAALSGLPAAAGAPQGEPGRKPAVPVTAEPAAAKDVPVQIKTFGNAAAYTTVAIKALVGGPLTEVHIRDGQAVKTNDLLFSIDPRPYQAALRQAEAVLTRDQVQLKNAEVEAGRAEYLLEKKIGTQEERDRTRTAVEALKALIQADTAVLEKARLDLEYCTLRSPLDGRAGSVLVHRGNVVRAGDAGPLVIIHQIQPIYVSFSVPERHLPQIRKLVAERELPVRVVLPGDDQRPETGTLTFVDNAVDASTGTIRLKGTFANGQERLWPGQFVEVLFTLAVIPQAVVVPSRAIQTGQKGRYVFVVKPDRTAEMRPVTAGLDYGDETVVEQGLQPGETVVTDGHLRVAPGSAVEVKAGPEGGKRAGK